MATAYVRSPYNGTITGRTKHCVCPGDTCYGSGSDHGSCKGGSWAGTSIDVSGSGDLYLRVNYPTVRSVVTWVALECCGGSGCADQYRRMVTVDLYALPNAVCYIGSVAYGHVANPQVGNGQTYNLTSSSKMLGTAASGSCGTCSTGPHAHMERLFGSTVAPCCCTTVTTATNIYKWNFDPLHCPTKLASG